MGSLASAGHKGSHPGKMAEIPLALPLGLFLSIIIASATASTPPGFTLINTCCPPGSFLVIEDWQGSKQQPDGVWKYLPDSDPGYGDSGSDSESGSGSGTHRTGSGDSGSGSGTADTSNTAESGSGNLPQPTPKIAALKKFRSHQRGWRPSRDDWYNTLKWQYGRHNFINRVYCVPDKNNLPDIHNMPGSSYPRPPYWADAMAKALGRRTFEEYTWPLAENQTLWSQGDKLPSCPGGPDELATIVLGDGYSSGYSSRSVSPFLRLNQEGQLVGRYLNVLGTSEGLRFGMQLPERYERGETRLDDGSYIPSVPPPHGEETEVGVDFCLTWSTDPRTKLVPYDPATTSSPTERSEHQDPDDFRAEAFVRERGPIRLLEAVYCDPCKARVACSLITTIYWHDVQKYFDLGLWGKDDDVDPRDYPGWAPPVWAFIPYLDEDRNGKVSIQEFYDLRFVQIMRKAFDSLDANGDGVVKKNEAHLRSFLRVSPVRSFSKELFDLMDVNKDGYISVDDPDPAQWQRWNRNICTILPRWMQDACKSLMTTYFQTLVDKDGDMRVSLAEFQEPWIQLLHFLVVDPSKEVDVGQLVGRLEKLGEPERVVASLTQRLTPVLETFPKMFLLSLVESADKNANDAMEWEEFEGFGDFELFAEKWPKMWETFRREMLAGMWVGGSGGDKTCCVPTSSDLRRYFKSTDVIVRLFHNLFHHQDFLFPSWTPDD